VSRRGWVLFLTMGVIWGVPYLLIKVAVDVLTPATLVFCRTTIAAVILLPIALARRQVRPLLPRWLPLLAYTAVELVVPWYLLSSAEQKITSSLAGLLIAGVPLVSALIAWVTRSERLGVRRIIGLFIGLAGVAALIGLDVGGGDVWSYVQIGLTAVGYALGPAILARYLTDVPGMGVVAASLVLTAALYAPAGIAQLPRQWPSAKVIGSVVVLALLCTAVAFLLFFALIDEVGPVRATVITYINPAVAVALGVLLLNEPLTYGIVTGFALILLGSVVATRRAPAPVPAPEPVTTAP
jgi:drug/metabolite transporter (DMT)-like permease